MASLYITEYESGAFVGAGKLVPVGLEPALATQKVTFTGTAGNSSALNARTRFVRLHADSIMSFKVSVAGTAATTNDPRVALGATEYFGVQPGISLIISAIVNT